MVGDSNSICWGLQGDSQSDARRKQRLPGELAMDVAHAGPVAPGASARGKTLETPLFLRDATLIPPKFDGSKSQLIFINWIFGVYRYTPFSDSLVLAGISSLILGSSGESSFFNSRNIIYDCCGGKIGRISLSLVFNAFQGCLLGVD